MVDEETTSNDFPKSKTPREILNAIHDFAFQPPEGDEPKSPEAIRLELKRIRCGNGSRKSWKSGSERNERASHRKGVSHEMPNALPDHPRKRSNFEYR